MVSKINQLLHLIFLALNYYLVKKKKILTLNFLNLNIFQYFYKELFI